MDFSGREVILGIGGGISAYKSAELLRRLQDVGFDITVVPTKTSLNFVGVATWEALSGHPVVSNLWNNIHDVPHIKLAKKANAIFIAPTTADLLAKLANGLADDLLTNIVLASTAPLILIPAMHPEMWSHKATQENVNRLRERGVLVIEPDEGRMTGEDIGVGRYPTVDRIIKEASTFLRINSPLSGKRILVTAGGTREPIDPVRFIGNRSSGKQGFAIAKIAAQQGAQVTLIAANCDLSTPPGVRRIDVESALDLQDALIAEFVDTQALFMTAAVADARVKNASDRKIKKSDLSALELSPNPDLLANLKAIKKGQVVVAFAAETSGDLIVEGKRKLDAKGADYIYVNDVSNGAIFGSDQTGGWIIDSAGNVEKFEQNNKDTLALELLKRAQIKLG
jgi:phosphopantothenoylcysteine decarboxylase/phosphopantothenate--cysteine ligase